MFEPSQGIDAYDISDPVDILKDLARFDDDVAKTEKWALRKAVLTRLKILAKVRAASASSGCVICVSASAALVGVLASVLQRRHRSL